MKWKRWLVALFIGSIIVLPFSTRFFSLSMTDDEIDQSFSGFDFKPEHHFEEVDEGALHYVTIGDKQNNPLLLIHGSPGSWDAWVSIMTNTELLDDYFVIAIDRVGYNDTSIDPGYTLEAQSKLIAPIMDKYCNPCTVAGHSYGGALALQLGMDFESKVSGLVSIAGTIAMPYQSPKWYNYLVTFSPARWLISAELKSSNYEMMLLHKDLRRWKGRLEQMRQKIAFIQGGSDTLVNPESLSYVQPYLQKANVSTYFSELRDHFIIWNELDVVIEAINAVSR